MTKIVLPYDKSELTDKDRDFLDQIRPDIGMLKIGLEAISARDDESGFRIADLVYDHFTDDGSNVLGDFKLHDIPNTIAGAVRNLAGKWGGVTIHASAGGSGLSAAVQARHEIIGGRSGIMPDDSTPWTTLFGVTVLTSHDEEECFHIFGDSPGDKVLQFARDCIDAGVDGLVCSGKELALLKEKGLADKLTTLIPGIRPKWADTGDQKRVMTPGEAAKLGANYIVIGRPIWNAKDPLDAIKRIRDEIAEAA